MTESEAKNAQETPQELEAPLSYVQHRPESTILAFSVFTHEESRSQWNVTLREGCTPRDIDDLLGNIEHLIASGEGRGFRVGSKQPPQRRPHTPAEQQAREEEYQEQQEEQRPAQPQRTGRSGPGFVDLENPGDLEVCRVVVEGTKKEPKLALWSPSKKLKHAIFPAVPAGIAIDLILRDNQGLPEGPVKDKLTDLGEEYEVNWLVSWEPSPKNPAWKDVTGIKVRKEK